MTAARESASLDILISWNHDGKLGTSPDQEHGLRLDPDLAGGRRRIPARLRPGAQAACAVTAPVDHPATGTLAVSKEDPSSLAEVYRAAGGLPSCRCPSAGSPRWARSSCGTGVGFGAGGVQEGVTGELLGSVAAAWADAHALHAQRRDRVVGAPSESGHDRCGCFCRGQLPGRVSPVEYPHPTRLARHGAPSLLASGRTDDGRGSVAGTWPARRASPSAVRQ
jgi:hypothetical protein